MECSVSSLFQFHKGTIKARFGTVSAFAAHAFQFHKGTIKALCRHQRTVVVPQFQFHKGTIKAFSKEITSDSQDISIP